MSNKTNGTTQNKETVKDTHLQVVFSFLCAESAAVAQKINEADSNTTVNVENKIVLFGSCDGLDSNGVIEKLARREVGVDKLLDELNTEIRIVARLDPVSNTRD